MSALSELKKRDEREQPSLVEKLNMLRRGEIRPSEAE